MTVSLPLTKTALVLIPRLIVENDRPNMLRAFDQQARSARASQVGANHVLQVVLRTEYYTTYGEGLQGGAGSGPRDSPRDRKAELEWVLSARFPPLDVPPGTKPGEFRVAHWT